MMQNTRRKSKTLLHLIDIILKKMKISNIECQKRKSEEEYKREESEWSGLGLENKTLAKNHVISGEISLFPECSPAKI